MTSHAGDNAGPVRGAGEADGSVRGLRGVSHRGRRAEQGGRPSERKAARRICEDQSHHRRNEGLTICIYLTFIVSDTRG